MNRLISRNWIGLIALAFLATGSPALAAVNLLVNPGFEDGGGSYTDWSTFGSHVLLSLPGGDNIIRTGAAASKIYGEYLGCPSSPVFNVSGYFQKFTPTVGKVYEFSGFSYVSGADPIPGTDTCYRNRALAKVVFFNAAVGGSEIASNEIVIGDGNFPVNQWTAFTVSTPAPAGAQRVQAMILYLQPGCEGGAVYVDDLSFSELPASSEPSCLTNPSFTTNLNGWGKNGNVYFEGRSSAVRTPNGSAKLFSTFVPDFNSELFQSLPAAAGSAWKLSVHAMTTCLEDDQIGVGNDNFVIARIVFRDGSNNEIGANPIETRILDGSVSPGAWIQHTVYSGIAPAGTAFVQAYFLFISPTQMGGAAWLDDASLCQLSATEVPDASPPVTFRLLQNAPNPFRLSTRIDFSLTQADAVDLSVYDVAGRKIATLVQGLLGAGAHDATWDGQTASGAPAAAGMYRYVLSTSAGRTSRAMLLIK